ncbi:MAG: hypothetical protein OXG81_13400 [Acidobacteria bacterium]|nr:hypothetical protein [Acidobacteriota bacterium]
MNVEVVVTDEQGRRVHGLTAADFELLVDGRPVPLDYFSEIREGRAVASPAGDVPTVPALRPNAPVGRSFLVFIDDFFSIKQDRDRVGGGAGPRPGLPGRHQLPRLHRRLLLRSARP